MEDLVLGFLIGCGVTLGLHIISMERKKNKEEELSETTQNEYVEVTGREKTLQEQWDEVEEMNAEEYTKRIKGGLGTLDTDGWLNENMKIMFQVEASKSSTQLLTDFDVSVIHNIANSISNHMKSIDIFEACDIAKEIITSKGYTNIKEQHIKYIESLGYEVEVEPNQVLRVSVKY